MNFKVVIYFLFCFYLFSCQPEENRLIFQADFRQLEKTNNADLDATVGVWGGSGKQKVKSIELTNCTFEIEKGNLKLNFENEGEIFIHPSALKLPAKWPTAERLILRILENESPLVLTVEVFGSRSRIGNTWELPKGSTSVELDIREAPLLGGLESQILGIKITSTERVQLILADLKVINSGNYTQLVDEWGQLKLRNYTNKVTKIEDLKNTDAEREFLSTLEKKYQTDSFGGYMIEGIEFEKKGFFYVKKINGHWVMITPEGNPFYSLGVNGVRRKSTLNNAALTRIKDRENIFQSIPDHSACSECFSSDFAYLSFYCFNVRQKYDGDYAKWKTTTLDRLQQVGFNTIGNWSDTLVMTDQFPFTYTLDSRVSTGLRAGHHLPDVFHPEFEERLQKNFSEIQKLQDNPYLLGYFVDNEMGWGGVMKLDSTSYSFKHLQQFPKAEWQKRFAEKYFSTIRNTIRQYDNNHLYLGCRFTRRLKGIEEIVSTGANYFDVLSVNVYSMFSKEEMDAWYEVAQKPILIGEHHVPPSTERALLPRYEAFDENTRDEMLEHYLTTWASYAYAVGSHWYQYADQEVSGRGDGGENQPVGLVSITDKLNIPLAEKYHALSKAIHENYEKRLSGK